MHISDEQRECTPLLPILPISPCAGYVVLPLTENDEFFGRMYDVASTGAVIIPISSQYARRIKFQRSASTILKTQR